MRVERCNPVTDKRWGRLVEAHPSSSIFQHPLYLQVLARTYKQLEPCAFVLTDESGNCTAGIPFFWVKSWLTGNRLVSLPFSSYSDPLVKTKEEFQLLLQEVLDFFGKGHMDYIEFKLFAGAEYFRDNPLFASIYDQKTHVLKLCQDLNILQRNFDRTNVRQKIARAEKSGIVIHNATTEKELHSFYTLLLKSRKRLGLPPQDYSFFFNMWQLLLPAGNLNLLCAELNGLEIGFLLYFKFRRTVYAEYIASNHDKFLLGVNQALFWAAIRQEICAGYEFFDFGKSSVNNLGLLSSKRRWGAAEREAPSYYYPSSKAVSTAKEERLSYKLLSYFYKKMPYTVSRMTSRFLYRHMG